ncbi:C69 family dipeptidase [Candidatus Poribacteria bacterium]|nr:C69 family dipeptidase [Candidatus Poribacteria bacterium]
MLKSCDTMVALPGTTTDRQMLFAKNSDRPATECQPLVQHTRESHATGAMTECQFVQFPQVSTTYRHVASRPYWCWGYEHGFNEYQVVIGNEGLASKEEFDSPKLIGMELIRLGLERARTAAEAVDVMTELVTQYGQGKFSNDQGVRTYDNGYIVADPNEAYIIETAGHEWAVKRAQGAVGISNVYSLADDWERLSPTAIERARERGWWTPLPSLPSPEEEGKGERWGVGEGRFDFADAYSREADRSVGGGAMRRRRSCAVLSKCSGRIDVQTMMALLSDHSDGSAPDEPFQTEISKGTSICVHHNAEGTGGNTAASLVAHLCADGSRLPVYWCSLYSPCLGVFLPMYIEGDLPSVLAVGGEHPSNHSPWWLFRQLSLRVRSDSTDLLPIVQAQWKAFQDRLFVSAYKMAKEGKVLIDQGRETAAHQLLTRYMAENVTTMLKMVWQMLSLTVESTEMAAD